MIAVPRSGRPFIRFNAQKTVTIALNLALYVGLLRLGMNYLVANVVLTVVFTVVNFVAGDRLVFVPGRARVAEPAESSVAVPLTERPVRSVSLAVPCRNNEGTIAATVQSLLDQDYPGLGEIVLVGLPGDRTWKACRQSTIRGCRSGKWRPRRVCVTLTSSGMPP